MGGDGVGVEDGVGVKDGGGVDDGDCALVDEGGGMLLVAVSLLNMGVWVSFVSMARFVSPPPTTDPSTPPSGIKMKSIKRTRVESRSDGRLDLRVNT